MAEETELDVLAVFSHPDDAELTMAGTLLKLKALGYRTGVVDMTRGEMGTRGTPEIVGVGGIFNAEDAWEKVCAGASLVQLYTGFIYEGLGVARRINEGLAALVKGHGFRTLDEAVGCRADEFPPP